MQFNIIQFPIFKLVTYLFPLLIVIPYSFEIKNMFKATFKDCVRFYHNEITFGNLTMHSSIYLAQCLDALANKFFLCIHMIAETAFSIAGQGKSSVGSARRNKINLSAIIGIVTEYIIDRPSNDVNKVSHYHIHDNGNHSNILSYSLIPLAFLTLAVLLNICSLLFFNYINLPSFYQVACCCILPLCAWVYTNYNNMNLMRLMVRRIDIKSLLTFDNSLLACCHIAAAAQGLFTALELKDLSANVFSYLMISLTTMATVVIEGNVYKDFV